MDASTAIMNDGMLGERRGKRSARNSASAGLRGPLRHGGRSTLPDGTLNGVPRPKPMATT